MNSHKEGCKEKKTITQPSNYTYEQMQVHHPIGKIKVKTWAIAHLLGRPP